MVVVVGGGGGWWTFVGKDGRDEVQLMCRALDSLQGDIMGSE